MFKIVVFPFFTSKLNGRLVSLVVPLFATFTVTYCTDFSEAPPLGLVISVICTSFDGFTTLSV